MTLKVGILGLAGAGKDTFASMLQEELSKLGHDFKIDRYARPIKELTSSIFGLTLDEVEHRVTKELPTRISLAVLLNECNAMLQYTLKFNPREVEQAQDLLYKYFAGCTALSPRQFQQYFGTDVVRAVRPNAWVDILQERDENLIVPDVRFENELCDYNILITGRIGIDKPKPIHSSEMYAWDLEHDWNTPLPKDHFDVVENVFIQGLDPLRVKALAQAVLIVKQL